MLEKECLDLIKRFKSLFIRFSRHKKNSSKYQKFFSKVGKIVLGCSISAADISVVDIFVVDNSVVYMSMAEWQTC